MIVNAANPSKGIEETDGGTEETDGGTEETDGGTEDIMLGMELMDDQDDDDDSFVCENIAVVMTIVVIMTVYRCYNLDLIIH